MASIKPILFALFCLITLVRLQAQELNCSVSINTPKVEGTERKVYETMQNAIREFINSRKWSNYNVRESERIECTIMITINERLGVDEFKGTMNVVLRRPVLNAAYNSVLLNTIDKNIQFHYVEFQPLDFSDGTFSSNLTALLAYYSYTVLGFYFDSFSPSGGTPFFEKAQTVVSSAQNAAEVGWKAYESEKNRWWLNNNYMNAANSGLREFSYKYHHLGLDQMYEKVDQGRTSVSSAIELLQGIYNAKPGLYALQLIFDAKRDEIINIFSDQRVAPMEKTTVVNIMKEIDPASSSKYQTILDAK
ncbi:MAG: DUF4835 family protein [Bacteroidota bacterium]